MGKEVILDVWKLRTLNELGVSVYCQGRPVPNLFEVNLSQGYVLFYTPSKEGRPHIADKDAPRDVRMVHTTMRFGPIEFRQERYAR